MARLARSLLLLCIALGVGAVLFTSRMKTYPISPVCGGAAWNNEQESVSTLNHAEPTETQSPHSVGDLSADTDVGKRNEPGLQNQPCPTAVTSKTTINSHFSLSVVRKSLIVQPTQMTMPDWILKLGFLGGLPARCIFDIRIFNLFAPSNQSSLKSIYKRHEKEKHRAYEQRVINIEHGSLTPLVFSACVWGGGAWDQPSK